MFSSQSTEPGVAVAVIGICDAQHIGRCLEALAGQRDAPRFATIVVYDPRLREAEALERRHSGVRFVRHDDHRNPLELASRAIREADAEVILLTEDHCCPGPDWVRRMTVSATSERGAVGGGVEPPAEASATEWAFYFVDFFRYLGPLREGPAPSLTVCNAGYRKDHLEAARECWEEFFHETAVHDLLRERFGPLWLLADAAVQTRRKVRFWDGVRERLALGRLFGCTRLRFVSARRRWLYVCLAPGLPGLLLARMAAKALRSPRSRLRYLAALPALTTLVVAWSWGEWLGYLTRRAPKEISLAQQIRTASGAPKT